MKKKVVLLFIFISSFTSCEEEVDYNDLGVKNLIVLNGRFVDGENPWCQVSRSDIIFEQINSAISPTTFLPDAIVSVNEGSSEYIYNVVADSAVMEAEALTVKAGGTYKLRASANGFEDVYSTITVPTKPKADFRLVSKEPELEISVGNFLRYKIYYELNVHDDPDTEDYYQIKFGTVDSTMTFEETIRPLWTNDPVFKGKQSQLEDNLLSDKTNERTGIFSDELFNGQTSKISFFKYTYDSGYDMENGEQLYYEVRHISKEMYMYYKTLQNVRDNEMNGSLAPYMLYCNVENGAGLVAAWSSIRGEVKKLKQSD